MEDDFLSYTPGEPLFYSSEKNTITTIIIAILLFSIQLLFIGCVFLKINRV